jgi:hypothetical protein
MHSTRLTGTRHPHMVLQRRATRNRRRQQDPHWQQVRLGREARRLDRTGPGPCRRARHSLPRSLGKEQHQRRQGILLARIRYQEALDRHGENRPDGRAQGGRGAIWRRKWRRYGWQVLLERGHGHVGDEQGRRIPGRQKCRTFAWAWLPLRPTAHAAGHLESWL